MKLGCYVGIGSYNYSQVPNKRPGTRIYFQENASLLLCISASVCSLEAGSLERCQKVVGDFLGSLKSRQNIEHWEAAWQGDRGSLQGRAKVLLTVTHDDKSLVVKQKKSLPANNNLQTDRQVQNFAEPVKFPRSRF